MLLCNDGVTVCVTSCGRWDLLYRSLSSFLEWNTYPVYEVLVWEDGGVGVPDNLGSLGLGSRLRLLGGDRWRGQVSAVDGMYSEVGTGYIFHMEDDWEFYRGGFIEASKLVLDVYSDISVVWLRELWDTNGHGFSVDGRGLRLMDVGYNGWHGFTFNPGLRRLGDWLLLGGYGSYVNFDLSCPWRSEMVIGSEYYRRRYIVILG